MKISVIFSIILLAIILTITACGDNGDPESPNPTLTGSVNITGTAQEGQTLTANTSNLGGSGTISYQWKRNGITNIGMNRNTYVVQTVDIGSTITVTVTRRGYSGSVTSSATATVVNNTLPALTGNITITGTATVGQTLSVNVSNLGGTGDISYQWKRGNSSTTAVTNITDAVASTYILVTADEGKYITVTVTRSGNSGSVTSESTNAIAAAPVLTGTVSITGTAKVGQTLTVNTTSLEGSGTISYQWRRAIFGSFTDIVGATSATYLLTVDDFDKYIVVVVTRAGNSSSVTSPSTSAVADVMTWTQISQSWFSSINSIAYNGTNLWVAVGSGSGGGASTGARIAPSADGLTWTDINDEYFVSFYGGSFNGVAYGDGRWIIVGDWMMTSTNGQKPWATIDVSNIFIEGVPGVSMSETINDIVYGNNRWIAIGNRSSMGTSTDGTNWIKVTQPLTPITSVAYGNNRWIAVGLTSMATSTDGLNWTPVDVSNVFPNGGGRSINTVAYANNLWIAAGSNGIMATSTNGINWTAVPGNPFGTDTIRTIAYGNNKWVAAGNRIAFSSDGINWTFVANTSLSGNSINRIAFGNDKWIAVGSGGGIAYAIDN
jgi:hypothetical protein